MSKEEEFEVLRKDYILKALSHLKLLEDLSYHQFSEIGMKSILANSRAESVTSYAHLILFINEVKVKV